MQEEASKSVPNSLQGQRPKATKLQYTHFTDTETEVQRGDVTCRKLPHNRPMPQRNAVQPPDVSVAEGLD